jgi:hypothetical protein
MAWLLSEQNLQAMIGPWLDAPEDLVGWRGDTPYVIGMQGEALPDQPIDALMDGDIVCFMRSERFGSALVSAPADGAVGSVPRMPARANVAVFGGNPELFGPNVATLHRIVRDNCGDIGPYGVEFL